MYNLDRLLSTVFQTLHEPRQKEDRLDHKQKDSDHLCKKHVKGLELFCESDETLVCSLCVPDHRGHNFLNIQQAVSIYKKKLNTATDALELKLKYITELQLKQAEKIDYIQDKTQSLEQNITTEFARLYQFLHDKEKQLIQQLKEEANGILEKMKKSLNEIQKMAEAIKRQMSDINSTLQQEDPLLFLSSLTNETERNKDSQEVKTDAVALVSDDLTLWVYKCPLQYKVWKEMLSTLNPGLSHISLDPNTAHPTLILSKNLTSIRSGDQRKELPDNPERFDLERCVLGSEGFTSGRHYWEVEVENTTDWDIGVARESIVRKGSILITRKTGYWAVRLWDENQYYALETPWKHLSLSVKPQRIGVYLDYEGGQVSFYNADNMSHIYTFFETFTERIYPYFCPGFNNVPLELFHLKPQCEPEWTVDYCDRNCCILKCLYYKHHIRYTD
ncbi:zinc-binding protein A33-like [Protopterus annectens]|uniref:zinc-binding protein A33-like n=1 Tax=Protopterus annectens TaxID=7888 RepID=UPI001CFA0818|nr:zinc-binding protein A33-like [Protopterus annectens]